MEKNQSKNNEYISEVKRQGRGIGKVLFYKPYNSDTYVKCNLIINSQKNSKPFMIFDIVHNVKLPNNVRRMYKKEYNLSILRYLDFIDTIYE